MKTSILITGANTGIGRACAEQLAGPDVRLILACRSREKTEPVLEALRKRGADVEFIALDLGDLEKASAAGRAFARHNASLDILINNAGLAAARGLTKDGYELAFGTNHLGHFAFTLPLLPLLAKAKGRIVNVSSGNHFKAKAIDFDKLRTATRTRTGLPEYGVSKLANVLFTAELRRRYPEITSVAMNPGRIASDVWRQMPPFLMPILRFFLPMEPVETGGDRLVHAARVKPAADGSLPLYFHDRKERAANPLALSENLATDLWRYSAEALAQVHNAEQASEGLHAATA